MNVVRLLALVIVGALWAGGGCSDPCSQRRIERRNARLRDQADGMARQERHNADRLREEGETVKHWWKRDCEDFNAKAPTAGDYVW